MLFISVEPAGSPAGPYAHCSPFNIYFMRGSIKILSVRGINLFIHWTFLLLIGWVLLVNAQSGNNIEQLSWSILFVIAVFASVALHEFGHAVTAMEYGIQAKNIILLPIGGVASIEKFPANPRQELLISISGPLINLSLAGLLKILFPAQTVMPDEYWQVSIKHGHDFILNLFIANIGLALFNLIPAFPLDGGRILRALLAFKLNYIRATAIANVIGKIIAAAFIGLGIVLLNPLLPVAGIFIMFAAGTEEYYLRIRSLVKGIKLKEVMMYDYNSLQHHLTIKEAANVLLNNHSKYFVLMDGDVPAGSINRMEIVSAMAEMKYDLVLKDLKTEALPSLDGDKEVDAVLEKLALNDEKIYPVMVKGHFAGVVNLNHIIEYMLLHKANTNDYKRVKSFAVLLH